MTCPFGTENFIWLRRAFDGDSVHRLRELTNTDGRAGARIKLEPEISNVLRNGISSRFPAYFPTRIVGFAKTETENWKLPWHQDRVIALTQQHKVEGFENWSRKDSIWHCEPPVEILSKMIFARIFLDDCDAKSGAMEFALGSHRNGIVASDSASALAETYETMFETAAAGDMLLLPMLTLHRSGKTDPGKVRRVIRVDFAADTLPSPLSWCK